MRRLSVATLSLLAFGATPAATAGAQQPVAAAPRPQSPAAAPASGEYPGLETGKMWTFDVPPLEYWARRYNFRPTQDWLDHVRLASVRQGGPPPVAGCSASFVSADGLVMTNHHCARACIDAVTRQGEDLLTNGFYSRTRAEERACPNYQLDQLLSITDVTDSVNAAVPAAALARR
ncbi:MAG: S46 family peptidase, partial [Gemmatimonadales bacterium]|nr:S46 family peptidase [Gemmatimonadales bacterium]